MWDWEFVCCRRAAELVCSIRCCPCKDFKCRAKIKRITEILLLRWLCPHHFLILMVTSVALSIFSGYVITVGSSNMATWFPYITYKTTEPPASCIFGILLNLSVLFMLICLYTRHRYFECDALNNQVNFVINDVSMFLGLVACFGIIVLTCLQLTKASIPHFIGAFLVYIIGNVYCWLQSYLTYATIGTLSTKKQSVLRLIVCAVSTLSFILTSALGSVAASEANVKQIRENCVWTADDPGYSAHLGSSFFQWIMTLSLLLYFLTFYYDFRRISCQLKIQNTNLETDQVEEIDSTEQYKDEVPEETGGTSDETSRETGKSRGKERRGGRVQFEESDPPESDPPESPPVEVDNR